MATKLQELLEELEGLPKCSCRVDCDGDADYLQTEHGTLIESVLIDQLITKYSETTLIYKEKMNVRITKYLYGHEFDILERVTLLQWDSEDRMWIASNGRCTWQINEEEFEPIN